MDIGLPFGRLLGVWILVLMVFSFTQREAGSSQNFLPVSEDEKQFLQKILERYRSEGVRIKVHRESVVGMLGRKSESKGILEIHSSNLRLDLTGDETSQLIVKEDEVVLMNGPPANFPDMPWQVFRGEGDQIQSNAFFALLSRRGSLEEFIWTGTRIEGEVQTFFLEPKSRMADVKRLKIKIHKEYRRMVLIKVFDERENITTYRLENTQFGVDIPTKRFEVKIPKNAEIVEN